MARLGHAVRLIVPTVKNSIEEHPHAYYGMESSIVIERLKSFDALNARFIPEVLALHLSMHSYRKLLKSTLRKSRTDLLYTRSIHTVSACLKTGIPTMLELHELPRWKKRSFIRSCEACIRVICLTKQQKETLIAWGVTESRIMVEHDGVDIQLFENLTVETNARKEEWHLPRSGVIVGYIGSLETGHGLKKGIEELIEAMALLKEKRIRAYCWIIGGPMNAISRYREQSALCGLSEDDIRFEGKIASSLVPRAIGACDICVYPAPKSNHPFFQRDTSPLKLFEYLAAGKPIVCADVPTIRDVVDASIVVLCKPGDPQTLAAGMTEMLEKRDQWEALGAKGRAIATEHSWDKRMHRILGERKTEIQSRA